MNPATPDLESLAVRMEKLEKQNRLLKRSGLALLLLPLCVALMGQAGPARTIEAQSFVLRDSNGIKRAELAMAKGDAILRFFNSKEQQTSTVSDGFIFLIDPQHTKATAEAGYVMLSMVQEEPSIIIRDTQGFSATLGVADTVTTVTGEQHKTTAASLKLFGPGKDGRVIWSTP